MSDVLLYLFLLNGLFQTVLLLRADRRATLKDREMARIEEVVLLPVEATVDHDRRHRQQRPTAPLHTRERKPATQIPPAKKED